MSLIDAAEMYADGGAEQVVADAIAGRRDEVFLVSKVYPHNAGGRRLETALDKSLRRLKVETIDWYLLHWRGSVPFAETIAGFEALQAAGTIRHCGVSNLDISEMHEWWTHAPGRAMATNQILYNLTRRGPEWDLLPWLAERNIPVMAYSPIEQAQLLRHAGLVKFAREHGMTPAQTALAWLLSKDGVIAIPKTGIRARLRENAGAILRTLDVEQIAELNEHFPPPRRASALEML
jgi:diketogulonate reductase-like aldo/keto reductase